MRACNKVFVGFAILAGLGLGVVSSAAAADAKTDKSGPNVQKSPKGVKETPAAKAIRNLELANELIRYGRQEKCAECLLMAAQLIHKTPTRPLDVKYTITGGKEETTTKMPAKKDNSPKALVAEAKKLSSSPECEALVMATEKMLKDTTRGAVAGPGRDSFRVGAYQTVNWNPITFRANERAVVYISVGVPSTMVLEVIDENGVVVARDSVPGNYYQCVWYPRWTGPFRIRLTSNDNLGLFCTLTTN